MRARKGSPVSKFKAASSNVANAAKRRSQEPGREPGFALRSPSTESLVVSLVVSRARPRVRVRVYGPVLLAIQLDQHWELTLSSCGSASTRISIAGLLRVNLNNFFFDELPGILALPDAFARPRGLGWP